MKMTKSNAMTTLTNAVNDMMTNAEVMNLMSYTDDQQEKLREAIEVALSYKATLDKPHTISPETAAKQAKAAEERKAATAKARAEMISNVAPILRKHLTTDVTVKELTEMASAELPEGFTWHMVQNILSREMKPELVRTERKKGGDLYRLA